MNGRSPTPWPEDRHARRIARSVLRAALRPRTTRIQARLKGGLPGVPGARARRSVSRPKDRSATLKVVLIREEANRAPGPASLHTATRRIMRRRIHRDAMACSLLLQPFIQGDSTPRTTLVMYAVSPGISCRDLIRQRFLALRSALRSSIPISPMIRAGPGRGSIGFARALSQRCVQPSRSMLWPSLSDV